MMVGNDSVAVGNDLRCLGAFSLGTEATLKQGAAKDEWLFVSMTEKLLSEGC
jgi:hypothetical protein